MGRGGTGWAAGGCARQAAAERAAGRVHVFLFLGSGVVVLSSVNSKCTCPGGPSSHNPDVPPVQSEDCLNVNIYAPANQSMQLLPVLIWFHGGAFKEGCNQGPIVGNGSLALYDGSSLVRDHNAILHDEGPESLH